MYKDDYQSMLTDEQIIRIILKRKRRQRMIRRVAMRSSVLLLIAIMMIYALVVGVQHLFIKDSHAASAKETKPIRGTIFLDAGHGGIDPGAEALDRKEKDDTLTMTLAIRKELKKQGFKVEISRTTDTYVDRPERAKMANKANAGFMVSIHRNKALEGQGIEMWIPSDNGDRDRALGENIMTELEKVGITQNRGVRSGTLPNPNDDYSENEYSNMPSVLIEFGFISDEEDNKLFDSKTQAYAKAVAKGISNTYADLYEQEQTKEQ